MRASGRFVVEHATYQNAIRVRLQGQMANNSSNNKKKHFRGMGQQLDKHTDAEYHTHHLAQATARAGAEIHIPERSVNPESYAM